MKWIFVLLAIFSLSAAKPNKAKTASFEAGIEQILKGVDSKIHVGLEIVSLKNGQRLYQKNQDHLFVPCCSVKIFTGAAALGILGSDFRFETNLLVDGKIEDGILVGDIYLRGSGDPSLSFSDLEHLVSQLKMRNITEIRGNILIDNTAFDGIVQGPGWMWDEEIAFWNSPMDALVVNHNCVDVWVMPAEELAKRPRVCVSPCKDYMNVDNRIIMARETGEMDIKKGEGRDIIMKGTIGMGCACKTYQIPVDSPSAYAGYVFCEMLKKQGIPLQGEVQMGKTPLRAEVMATHTSLPLCVIVQHMMKTSDHLYASCLFKKMGELRYGTVGSWQNGSQAVRSYLSQEAGIDVSELVILDGTGLSRYNLVSPHQMVSFLTWAYKEFPLSAEFMASLPVAGIDGSLRGMKQDEVKGKVRAKPGKMTGLTALAGYAVTKEGEPIAFSLMTSGFVQQTETHKLGLEDEICAFIAQYSRK